MVMDASSLMADGSPVLPPSNKGHFLRVLAVIQQEDDRKNDKRQQDDYQ